MVELVDTLDLGSSANRFESSSLSSGTKNVPTVSTDSIKKRNIHGSFTIGWSPIKFASLAQLVEQIICNDQVVGSNPTRGSITLGMGKLVIRYIWDVEIAGSSPAT